MPSSRVTPLAIPNRAKDSVSTPHYPQVHYLTLICAGIGHIAIAVDDIEAACARFEQLGVPFKKKLTDGNMKNIAFILDPDG